MAAGTGHADAVEGVDGLVQAADAGDVGGGHEHQVGGVVHHRERALAEAGVGVDHDVPELEGELLDQAGHLLGADAVGVGRVARAAQGVDPRRVGGQEGFEDHGVLGGGTGHGVEHRVLGV